MGSKPLNEKGVRMKKSKQKTEEQKYIFHLLDDVKALDNFMLEAKFKTGEKKLYDVKPLIERYNMFRLFLKNKDLFYKFNLSGGYALVWNDQVDLHCNELWNNGFEVN